MSNNQASISAALQYGINQLSCNASAACDSPKLDSEILLLKVLNGKPGDPNKYFTKSWLLTWPEKNLTPEQFKQFKYCLTLRAQGIPVAYITGEKEFWTLTLQVSPATLIPRPETELLVEYALDKIPLTEPANILDLGTGCGAIALSIASERASSMVMATDNSQEALAVARENAGKLALSNVNFCRSHWFDNIPGQGFDVIVSNPPYIAEHDPHLEDNVRKYEPLSALLSAGNGLNDIQHIIQHSQNFLKPGGWLIFEHGFEQAQSVRTLLKQSAFSQITTFKDLNQLERVTQARFIKV